MEDAEVAIILHCQTKNDPFPSGAFWDITAFRFNLWQPKATAPTCFMDLIGIGEQKRLA